MDKIKEVRRNLTQGKNFLKLKFEDHFDWLDVLKILGQIVLLFILILSKQKQIFFNFWKVFFSNLYWLQT